MARGSHASARQYYDFLRTEMADMARLGYWTVIPYRLIRRLLKRLRMSPAGVIPQRDRRHRSTIIDYTFSGVNNETLYLSTKNAMKFGRALHRLLLRIRFAPPAHGPVYMLKVDLSDGFYRVWLRPSDVPVLGIAFPTLPDEEPLLAFPLVLPMGFYESPPYFCALTETVANVTNDRLAARWDPPPHPLEHLASTPPPPLPGNHAIHLPSSSGMPKQHPLPDSPGPPRQSRVAPPLLLLTLMSTSTILLPWRKAVLPVPIMFIASCCIPSTKPFAPKCP